MSIVSNKQRNQTVTIDLLAFESETTFLLEPGVTTATFFKNTSFEKARQSLKTRYFEVLKANPWLAGRLIKQKGNQRVQLVYPQTVSGSNLETLFHDKEEIKIDLNTEYETIYKNITNNKKAYIVSGLKLKNKDKPLVSLTILKTYNKETVVIFSLSHIIGDGATYYSLLNMICSNDKITTLNPERLESYKVETAVGLPDKRYLGSMGFIVKSLLSWIFGPKSKIIAYTLSNQGIDDTKAKLNPSTTVPYISTNDIICSGFMRAIQAKLCLMAINFRERYFGVKRTHAGNYEGVMFYDKGVYDKPEGIRKSLQGHLPYKTRTHPLPGLWKTLRMNFGIISNWSSFAKDFYVDNNLFELHIPILPIKLPFDAMIIFKCRPSTSAVFILSKYHNQGYFTKNVKNPMYKYLDKPVSEYIFK